MLGREMLAACGRRDMDVHGFAGRKVLDITAPGAVRQMLRAKRPGVVINSSGYTNVDGAEADQDAAYRVNCHGPAELASACSDIGAILVHYSTDYVFNGRSCHLYRVDDNPDPVNVYGRSKLAGEQAVIDSGCRHLIVRTSWLFASHGGNFVRTIFELAGQRPALDVVDDQQGRPTSAIDLAEMTLDLLDGDAQGIVHAANAGYCSWYELARAVVELAGHDCTIQPCATNADARPAQRPRFSVLDLSETVRLIGLPRHWKDALADCIHELVMERTKQHGCLRTK